MAQQQRGSRASLPEPQPHALALKDRVIKAFNNRELTAIRLKELGLNEDLCAVVRVIRNMLVDKVFPSVIIQVPFDMEYWERKPDDKKLEDSIAGHDIVLILRNWLRCCIKSCNFDHRLLPVTQALEVIYDFQNDTNAHTETQAEVYKAGISMSILSKDFNELDRYTELFFVVQQRYRRKQVEEQREKQARGDKLLDRSPDYAMACKNRGIAQANLGRFEDAMFYLEMAKDNTQEGRQKSESALETESKKRYHRDLFEIYCHCGMVVGRMPRTRQAARQESESYFRKARDVFKHLSPGEVRLREIQIKYAETTLGFKSNCKRFFPQDFGSLPKTDREEILYSFTKCMVSYTSLIPTDPMIFTFSAYHRWRIMSQYRSQMACVTFATLDGESMLEAVCGSLRILCRLMDGREVHDRDHARASLLEVDVLNSVWRSDGSSLKEGVEAINRLETCRKRSESEFMKEYDEDLCPYDYLDSLDIEYGLIDDEGEA